jgi:hypothetical protein
MPRPEEGFNRAPVPLAPPAIRQPEVAPFIFNPAPRNEVEIESNRGRTSLEAPANRAVPAAPTLQREHR